MTALLSLAELQESAGNIVAAKGTALEAANRGEYAAISLLAWLHERAGDLLGAERLLRFGLTDDGAIANWLSTDANPFPP